MSAVPRCRSVTATPVFVTSPALTTTAYRLHTGRENPGPVLLGSHERLWPESWLLPLAPEALLDTGWTQAGVTGCR